MVIFEIIFVISLTITFHFKDISTFFRAECLSQFFHNSSLDNNKSIKNVDQFLILHEVLELKNDPDSKGCSEPKILVFFDLR